MNCLGSSNSNSQRGGLVHGEGGGGSLGAGIRSIKLATDRIATTNSETDKKKQSESEEIIVSESASLRGESESAPSIHGRCRLNCVIGRYAPGVKLTGGYFIVKQEWAPDGLFIHPSFHSPNPFAVRGIPISSRSESPLIHPT